MDQVDAEVLLAELHDAGLVTIRERRDRRGDWEPYLWSLSEQGQTVLRGLGGHEAEGLEAEVRAWLAREDPPNPAAPEYLATIRRALGGDGGRHPEALLRLLMALGDELRAGRTPSGRSLSVAVTGDSKRLRLEPHRDALEALFDAPLEAIVPPLGAAALAWGPFTFAVPHSPAPVDARFSVPWLAFTPETLDRMEDVRLGPGVERLLTIENLAPFEAFVRQDPPSDTIVLYTGGFPGRLEARLLGLLVDAGVRRVDHWGDLDPGGLRILRHVQRLAHPVPVRPFRMSPDLLTDPLLPTQPLTVRDRDSLRAWLDDSDAPFRDLAEALLQADRKLEQEAWRPRRQ